MSMQLGLGIHLGKVLPAGGPFAGMISLTNPEIIQFTRTGGRASAKSGYSDLAPDEIDHAKSGSLDIVDIYQGETNLVSTDLTTWTEGGVMGVWTATPGALGYTVAYSGGGASVLRGVFALSSTTRTLRCQMRLIAGTPPSSGNVYIALRESGTPREQYNLSNLTSDWTTITLTTNGTDATNELTFRGDGPAWTVEIRHIAVTDTDYPTLATPNNSAASASYGNDDATVLEADCQWGSGNGVLAVLYRVEYNATQWGPSNFARLWDIGGRRGLLRASDGREVFYSDGTPLAGQVAAALGGEVGLCLFEFNGTTKRVRFNDGTIKQNVDSSSFSGDLQIGANVALADFLNGGLALFYGEGKTLEDFDFDALKTYGQEAFARIYGQ